MDVEMHMLVDADMDTDADMDMNVDEDMNMVMEAALDRDIDTRHKYREYTRRHGHKARTWEPGVDNWEVNFLTVRKHSYCTAWYPPRNHLQ
jgi:hypothetical protein